MSTIDIGRVRGDTRGCEQVLHFNNAGSSLPPAAVADAVVDHLRLEESIGGYEAAAQVHERSEGVYDSVARLIGAHPDEIALVENATRAWDMAFYAMKFSPGDRILTARAEYVSNYIPFLQVAKRSGAVVEAIASEASGEICLDALDRAIDGNVRLIAITHVPTNGGLVNPAEEVGHIARRHGIPFLLDACQSVGQMPVDVKAIGCDMLSATGRKFLRGPRGTGFLYVRRDRISELEPPFLDLQAAEWTSPASYKIRQDARRFENWESYVAGRLGLGVAVDYAMGLGLEAIRDRVFGLAARLRRALRDIPGVAVHDIGKVQCGIVSFTKEGVAPSGVRTRLAGKRINVSVTGASSTLLDMQARGLSEAVRASVHYYNTEDEIDRFCAAVADIH
jgi:selenocysteine lyase/cysteine desulfurase